MTKYQTILTFEPSDGSPMALTSIQAHLPDGTIWIAGRSVLAAPAGSPRTFRQIAARFLDDIAPEPRQETAAFLAAQREADRLVEEARANGVAAAERKLQAELEAAAQRFSSALEERDLNFARQLDEVKASVSRRARLEAEQAVERQAQEAAVALSRAADAERAAEAAVAAAKVAEAAAEQRAAEARSALAIALEDARAANERAGALRAEVRTLRARLETADGGSGAAAG